MSKTCKPIASYSGGISSLIEAAISDSGKIYIRFQDHNPRYGYIWGKWQTCGDLGNGYIPYTMQCGFSVLRKNKQVKNFRLPIDTIASRLTITNDMCDCEENKYSD